MNPTKVSSRARRARDKMFSRCTTTEVYGTSHNPNYRGQVPLSTFPGSILPPDMPSGGFLVTPNSIPLVEDGLTVSLEGHRKGGPKYLIN